MRYKTIVVAILLCAGLTMVRAVDAPSDPAAASKSSIDKVAEKAEATAVAEEPVLPEKNSTEYWVVRSVAMTEFIPLLTKKRTELKKKAQLLADYLVKIGKADEFAALKMPVTYDAKVYTDILQIGEAFAQMNMEMPKERPSWDVLVEIAMKYVIYEGYWPTDVEEGEDAILYIEMCRKKEEYGQKVRKDIRVMLDQAAKVWFYLDSIGQLKNFKAYAADLILRQKTGKAREKAIYAQAHQEETIAQTRARQQRKFEDAEDRASFRSNRRERTYESYQDHLLYRQSRLDERFVNSRAYYY